MTLPVTVVVPAYRATETLARALASARGQEPSPPAEILVVDDGSQDGTAALARECGATVLVHEHNRGLAAARNTAVAAATQPWLAFLDADDEWLPHHLATLWPLREGHDLVAGSAIVWDPAPQRTRYHGPVRSARTARRGRRSRCWPIENYIAISAALARTEAVRAAGGFRPYAAAEDLDLWARLLTAGSAAVVPAVTIVYHVHPGQMSADDACRAGLAPARDRRARRRAVVEPRAVRALPRHARVAPGGARIPRRTAAIRRRHHREGAHEPGPGPRPRRVPRPPAARAARGRALGSDRRPRRIAAARGGSSRRG